MKYQKFKFIVDEYPNSDFAMDSRFKLGLIEDILAAKEMYLGRHYIKKGKWPDGLALASALYPYAETGDEYVESIKNIILQNNLQRFDYSILVN